MAIAPYCPMLLLAESLHCLHMLKTVSRLRLLAMAVAPESPMLLLSESLYCLRITKTVSYMRLFAMAVAPYCPMLLLSKSLHCLHMINIVRFLRFYAANCAPLSSTPMFYNECVPFEEMLISFTRGSCISSAVNFCIVLSVLSTAWNPLIVKVLLSSSALSAELPRRSSVSD
jgi:hypothetical protein